MNTVRHAQDVTNDCIREAVPGSGSLVKKASVEGVDIDPGQIQT